MNTTIQITLPVMKAKTCDLIAVERREWDSMRKHIHELQHALKVIGAGDREFRRGKTRTVSSLGELVH